MKPALALALMVLVASPALAQQAAPTPGPLARWIDLQLVTASLRYRANRNTDDELTGNHLQERTQLRLRLKLDPAARFSIHVGLFTGSGFTSGWNATSIGTGEGTAAHRFKQLFAAAVPTDGIELQYGAIYPSRGESTEITSYDDDGYLVGGRLSVQRPGTLGVDAVVVTIGNLGYMKTPGLDDRWRQFRDGPNYYQLQASQRIGRVTASFDYTRLDEENWFRPAAAVDLAESVVLDRARVEIYRRGKPEAAWGFALAGEKRVAPRLRLMGGYADVDPGYGQLNGDRYLSGKRLFLHVNVAVTSEFSIGFFTGHTVGDNPILPVRMRTDVVATYDLVPALRRTGLF